MKKISKNVLAVVLAFIMVFDSVPLEGLIENNAVPFGKSIINAYAATEYDHLKALKYAEEHWNDGQGLCAEFVSNCITAGGIKIMETYVGPLYDKLLPYGSVYELKINKSQVLFSDNKDKVSAGDPIFCYCKKCGKLKHVFLCGQQGDKMTIYQHNSAIGNKPAWNYRSKGYICNDCQCNTYKFVSIHLGNYQNTENEWDKNSTKVDNKIMLTMENSVYVRSGPDNTFSFYTINQINTPVTVVAQFKNNHDNLWYKISNGYWIFSKNLKDYLKVNMTMTTISNATSYNEPCEPFSKSRTLSTNQPVTIVGFISDKDGDRWYLTDKNDWISYIRLKGNSVPLKTFVRSILKIFKLKATVITGANAQSMSAESQSSSVEISAKDIAINDSVLITWGSVENANYYTVSINGIERPEQITDTQQVLLLDTAGVKTLQVRGYNDAGASEWSDPATVIVHDNVTVTFTVDGSTYQQISIPWGTTFYNYPAYPEKEGSAFTGWFKQGTTAVASFEELKSDLTVYAGFKLNTFAVTFLDHKGNVVKIQMVNFDEAATAPDAAGFIPEGYVLLGWNKDFSRVTGDLTVKAVLLWENKDLPITLTNVSCIRGYNGYTTYFTINNNLNDITTGRIVIALKTQEGKLITTTESNAFYLNANSSKTDSVYIPNAEVPIGASVAEVYAVKKFQATVPMSPSVTVSNITDEDPWSDWSDDIPPAGYAFENRPLYSSREKDFITNTSPLTADGLILYDTQSAWSDYGNWSDWSDTAVGASSSREVQTETRYKFYHYCTGKTSSSYSSYWVHYDPACMRTTTFDYHETGWMTSIPSSWHNMGTYEAEDTNKIHPIHIQYDDAGNKIRCSNTCFTYYPATKTVYRYRDRHLNYTYYYYRWKNWTDWNGTPISETSNRQVQTKTQYRYERFELGERVEDTSGVAQNLSRNAGVENAGKQATLVIYKMTEASDWTTEFIGQTKIADNGDYSFHFKFREEPSEITGDFTATLSIEGSTSAKYVDTFYAPVPEYQVTFSDFDGTILSTQTLQKGQNAVVPVSPQRTGYTFKGWDVCSTNIQSNLIVTAQYEINTYTVVFIDWLNHTYSVQTFEHGTPLTTPIIDTVAGKNILGWDKVLEGVSTVTSDMVICASFETQTFNVDFYDFTGNLMDSQVVKYGEYAEVPVLDEGNNYVFLNWQCPAMQALDLDMETEPVMKSLSATPNYVFTETVEMPCASVTTGEYDTAQTVELSCGTEGAVIYYTLDGSDPADPLNPAATEYSIPISVTESAQLRFYACALGKNDSEEITEYYAINRPGNDICHVLNISDWDESDYITQIVEDGLTIDAAVIPAIDGYSFEGLYRDDEQTLRWNMDTDTVTESMTLYINYTPNIYNVIFRDSDGTILDVQVVEYLSAAQAPEIIPPDGYIFTDWDTEDYFCVESDLTVTAVYVSESEYARISLDCGNYSMTAGNSFTLSAAITPAELSGKDILWYSSDDTVATVDENGIVTALSAGTATITVVVKENGESASCIVTVNANAAYQLCLVTGSILAVDTETGYLRGIKTTANTVAQVKAQFANTGLVFTSKTGAILADTGLVGTGTVITLVNGGTILDEITAVVTGDMNGDGLINNRDASMVTRYLVGKETPVACQITAIDVNADGFVNNRDAAMISRYLVGKEVI